MTTEDDFQAMIDANWEDWHTRLVFADWLAEHDDPRSDGYRWLGENKRVPLVYSVPELFDKDCVTFWTYDSGVYKHKTHWECYAVPESAIGSSPNVYLLPCLYFFRTKCKLPTGTRDTFTRKDCEDQFARLFAANMERN